MAKQRVEYQEMIDLDGLRKALADNRSDYKAYADDVLRLNDQMQKSALQVRNEIENVRRANASADDGKAQEAYAQRLAGLSLQYRDQKAAVDALNKVNNQLTEVTGTLFNRQQQAIEQYASINGNTRNDIALRNRLAKEMANLQNQFDRLDKATRASLGGAKEVTGQYNRLSNELNEARKELKLLDDAFDSNTGKLNKNNTAAVALSQRITTADTALKKMDAGMGQYGRNVGSYESALQGLVSGGFTGLLGTLGLVGVALTKVIEIGGEAIDKMSQFEQIRGGLQGVTKDSDDLAHSQEFLEQMADRLGVSYERLASAYKGIKIGTKGTAIEGAEADRIFKAFTTRLAELKAPAQQVESALLAVEQMLSKTTVQSQELHLQLANAMPGALQLFADALGVSTKELNKMMENGQLLAVDVLPKVADQLEKTFSGTAEDNVNQLTGATSRLDNQTGLLLDTFNQTAGITRFFASIKNGIADTLSGIRSALKSGDWITFFGALSPTQSGSVLRDGLKQLAAQQKQLQDFKGQSSDLREGRLGLIADQISKDLAYIKAIEQREAKLNSVFVNERNSDGKNMKFNGLKATLSTDAKAELQARIDENRKLLSQYGSANIEVSRQELNQRLIDERSADKTYHEKRVADVVKEAKSLSLDERNARIGKYQSQNKTMEAEMKSNPGLSATLTRDINYNKEFIKSIQDVNKELEKKDKKDAERDAKANTREAKQGAAKRLQEAKTTLSDSLSVSSSSTSAQLSTLSGQKEDGTIDEKKYVIDRYNITVAGITQRRGLLNDAHKQQIIDEKEFNKQVEALNAETAKAGEVYLKGKADVQAKAFKQTMSDVKDALSHDDTLINGNLTTRLEDLQDAYEKAEARIKIAVINRQLTSEQGEKQLHDLTLQYTGDVEKAMLAAFDTQAQLIKTRIETLKSQGKTDAEIAEAVQLEKANLDKVEEDRDKATKKRKKDDAREIGDAQVKSAQTAADKRAAIEEKIGELATAAVQGYVQTVNAFRDQDLANLEKQKENELATVGDNESAKANITQKYAAKEREIKRKQAVADKIAALFSIAINTAVAATKALATPYLIPFIIGLGAIEAAVVAARPLPNEFFKGTSDAPEGPAWVGEQGYELIESKKGGKPHYRIAAQKQLTYLNAHDRVYTHQETKHILQTNREIANEVRTAPGGSQYQPPVVIQSKGITKEEMIEALESQTIHQTIMSDGELKYYIKKKMQRTQWVNEHFSLPLKKR